MSPRSMASTLVFMPAAAGLSVGTTPVTPHFKELFPCSLLVLVIYFDSSGEVNLKESFLQ